MKRVMGAYLVLALLISAVYVAAKENKQDTFYMLGYEPAEQNRVWKNHLFFERMKEQTGIQFELEQITNVTQYQQRISSLHTTPESMPDVLFKANLSTNDIQTLYDQGVLVDLKPYLEEHAPHFFKLLKEDSNLRLSITLSSGAIPALPYVSLSPSQNALWINKKWLDELRLSLPETLEELTETLIAFKTMDPNRNGRMDETPLSFIGPYDLKYMLSVWGLAVNDYNIYVDDNKVCFLPDDERLVSFLHWGSDAFCKGLIDKEGFKTVDALRKQTDAKAVNRYGAFFAPLPNHIVPLEWVNDYQVIPPMKFEGKQVYRQIANPITNGAFAITTACEDIPLMLSWVDFLYTQPGAILATIGKEGEDYVVDGDGSWRLLRENSDSFYIAQTVIATDNSIPGISTEVFQRKYTDTIVAYINEQTELVACHAVLPFPPIILTAHEQAQVDVLQAKLGKYIDESIARFIIGEWTINEQQLNVFKDELKKLGSEQFVELWQKIYDRGVEVK